MLENIIKLKALAVTAKTSIYNEEAMTALELAGVTACKVNQCIDAINLMIEIVEELSSSVKTLEYDAENEEITI